MRGDFGAGREGRPTAKQRDRSVVIAHVEVRCAAAHVTANAERLALLPWAVSVYEVAGEFDLLLTVGAVDLPGLRRALRDDVSSPPGVGEVRGDDDAVRRGGRLADAGPVERRPGASAAAVTEWPRPVQRHRT
ncbi:Lrp/AsnC ligand binding domain-containing protein [Streptomyces sp. ME02-6991-2A]|uniref:Lrp/AsnC ligand binding domain-containing protein n=1 Tax=Streptomyces sp. ME02-6991-2A TaxID=3028677 RepID=UPI0039F65EA8